MDAQKILHRKRAARTRRTRAKISGDPRRPRLAVFRSNRFVYAQLIDDVAGKTLASASSRELKKGEGGKSKTDIAHAVGALLAKKAGERGITEAAFDRRAYAYHGRVRALAEGAKKGGLRI